MTVHKPSVAAGVSPLPLKIQLRLIERRWLSSPLAKSMHEAPSDAQARVSDAILAAMMPQGSRRLPIPFGESLADTARNGCHHSAQEYFRSLVYRGRSFPDLSVAMESVDSTGRALMAPEQTLSGHRSAAFRILMFGGVIAPPMVALSLSIWWTGLAPAALSVGGAVAAAIILGVVLLGKVVDSVFRSRGRRVQYVAVIGSVGAFCLWVMHSVFSMVTTRGFLLPSLGLILLGLADIALALFMIKTIERDLDRRSASVHSHSGQ